MSESERWSENNDSPIDESLLAWEAITDCLEQFAGAWEEFKLRQDLSATPPDISKYLPNASDDIKRVALSELIKLDLDYRWRLPVADPDAETIAVGRHVEPCVERLVVEDYSKRFPFLSVEGEIPAGLISRWRTPLSCAYCSAFANCTPTRAIASGQEQSSK